MILHYYFIGDGLCNTAAGHYSSILGGSGNLVTGHHAVIAGGVNNTSSGDYSSIFGGNNNNDMGFNYAAIFGQNVNAVASHTLHANNFAAQNMPTAPGNPGTFYKTLIGTTTVVAIS